MPRPCHCDRLDCCRLCYLYHHSSDYRRLWDEAAPLAAAPVLPAVPCEHLGEDTGERRRCSTCRGHVSLKVYACRHPAHAGEPTTTRQACLRCVDYAPRTGPLRAEP